ncbi:hypothetical protein [Devosia sp.]|uniref:apolipoprotein A-IV repeat region-like domain-containing protein n=1 Tax=Devosia sp. TaxID=1871048 RepID=UPI0035AE942F
MVKQTAKLVQGTTPPYAPHPGEEAEAGSGGGESAPGQTAHQPDLRLLALQIGWVGVVVAVALVEQGSNLLRPDLWLSATGLTLFISAALPVTILAAITAGAAQFRRLAAQYDGLHAMVARIAEPEPTSARNIVSIRHAMHKELATLNEQLDRSLNRTGEIETIIRREVATLEHSFAENERRMLALVQELARQRETVVTATEQVRDVVKANREALNGELAGLAAQVLEAGNYARGAVEEVGVEVRSELADSGARFAETLRQVVEGRIDPLNALLAGQVRTMEALLSNGHGGVVAVLETQGRQLVETLEGAWGRIGADMASQTRIAESVASRLVDTLDQSLESSVNRLENRVQSASLELLGVLDSAADQASRRILEVGSASTEMLDGRVAALGDRIDGQVRQLSGLIEGATDRLMPTIEHQNLTLERAIKLGGALEHSTSQLNAVLTHKATEFVDTLSLNLRLFQSQLSDGAQAISEDLRNKLDRATDMLDGSARRFDQTLLGVQDTISLAGDRLTVAAAEYNASFAERVDQIEELVLEGAERVGATLGQRSAELALTLADGSRSLEGALGVWSGRIGAVLGEGVRDAETSFELRLGEMRHAEEGHVQRVRELFGSASEAMSAVLTSSTDVLAAEVDRAEVGMAQVSGQFGASLAEQREAFVRELGQASSAARAALLDAAASGVAAFDTQIGELRASLQAQIVTVHGGLEARTLELEANVAAFGASIDAQTSRLGRVLGQKAEAMTREIEQGVDALDSTMSGHLGRAHTVIEAFSAREANLFADRMEVLDGAIARQSEDLAGRIDAVQELIETRGQQFETGMAQHGAGIEAQTARLEVALARSTQQLAGTMNEGTNRIGGELAAHLERTDGIVAQFVEQEQVRLDRQIDVLGRTLDGRAEILDSIIRTRGEDFTDRLHASSRRFEEGLADGGRALEGALRAATTHLESALSGQATTLRDLLTGASDQAEHGARQRLDSLLGAIHQLAARLDEALSGGLETLATRLADGKNDIRHLLDAGAARLGTMLDDGGGKLTGELAEHTGVLEQALTERIETLQTRLREQASSVDASLAEAAERLERSLHKAAGEIERATHASSAEVRANVAQALESAAQQMATGVDAAEQKVGAAFETMMVRLAAHERSAVSRMDAAATNVGESTRKAAELTAERLVTLNGAVVQVLNSLGAPRPHARKSKIELLQDAAE